MICQSCGTEIADKAIVCYRCGTATTEAVRKPAEIRRPRSPLIPILVILVVALAAFFLGRYYQVFGLHIPVYSVNAGAVYSVAVLIDFAHANA